MMKKTAIIAGATGLIGSSLTQLLLDSGRYEQVIVPVRRRLSIADARLLQVDARYEQLAEVISAEQMKEADVYITLGTTIKKAGTKEQFRKVDLEYPLAVGRLAKEQGAAQVLIVTAMGADRSSSIFYNQVKGEVEDKLTALGLSSLQIFRPSLLLGDRQEFRLGERIGMAASRVIAPLMLGGLRKYKPIHGRCVAKAMLAAAAEPPRGVKIYSSDEIAELCR
jgi:uncharacterized protein YbjT (DUF2867 family)